MLKTKYYSRAAYYSGIVHYYGTLYLEIAPTTGRTSKSAIRPYQKKRGEEKS
jgi:hypothetical protein